MAAKKKKFKLSKKQRKQLIFVVTSVGIGLTGLLLGIVLMNVVNARNVPTNLIWASEPSVKVPDDLRTFLETRNDCEHYRGIDTPTGVGLWGVYQTSQGKFAKIAYGCSWNLNSYIMAVKQKQGWLLIQPAEYFAPFKDGVDASKGALPFCTVIEKYKIPKDIESFCIKSDGTAQANTF